MSIADHFEHVPEAALVRDYDSSSARRQFKVSLVLIVVIAMGASALGFVVRFDQPAVAGGGSVVTPSYAGTLSR